MWKVWKSYKQDQQMGTANAQIYVKKNLFSSNPKNNLTKCMIK